VKVSLHPENKDDGAKELINIVITRQKNQKER